MTLKTHTQIFSTTFSFQFLRWFIAWARRLDSSIGTAAAANNVRPRSGRWAIQPIAMVTSVNDVARQRHNRVRPRPTSSRTTGNQDTGKEQDCIVKSFQNVGRQFRMVWASRTLVYRWNLCWRNWFHFPSLAYDCAEKASRLTQIEPVKLSNWWTFWVFECYIPGKIGFQKLQELWVARTLMSSHILCKILSF